MFRKLLLSTAAVLFMSSQARSQTACNRDCLRTMMTDYLNAMIAHKPETLPLAANARFTEDRKELKLGEGIWKTASRLRPYRQDILDVRQGVAGAHVIVEEAPPEPEPPRQATLERPLHVLALSGKSNVDVKFELTTPASEPLNVIWEYWDGELWQVFLNNRASCLEKTELFDGTGGFLYSGSFFLKADCAETKKRTISPASWRSLHAVLKEVSQTRATARRTRRSFFRWHWNARRAGAGVNVPRERGGSDTCPR